MTTIYKYELEIQNEQALYLPQGARLLSVGEQNGQLMLWAAVDTEKPKRNCYIRIEGTGNPASEELFYRSYDAPSRYSWEHVGTVQMDSGLVWHVFCKY